MTPPELEAGFASPSLTAPADGAGPAYEMKFLLDEARAGQVEDWARQRLMLDPHGDPALGGAYRTTSLYCDTPEMDVYHRRPSYKRRKYRVRRYGSADWLFLECKSKSKDQVQKQRTAIPESELAHLDPPLSVVEWPGHWFHKRLVQRRLGPACRVAYQRTAYAGVCSEGPLRLTLDRHVHGVPTAEWTLAPLEGGLPLLTGQVILELKFKVAMPLLFKELVRDLRLTPRGVSKYRLCREAWGGSPFREAADG